MKFIKWTKIKFKLLAFWHCLIWTIKDPDTDHRQIKHTNEIKILGIYIPFKTIFIGCTCGKIWYKKLSK